MPASMELKASSLSLIHLRAHLTALRVKVEALRKMIIEKYYKFNDFLIWAKPFVSDLNDFKSCKIELIIRPYFICFITCLSVSGIQPFGCLQNLVLAFIFVTFINDIINVYINVLIFIYLRYDILYGKINICKYLLSIV